LGVCLPFASLEGRFFKRRLARALAALSTDVLEIISFGS
jgi:hypothetical protein